jgi:hypothetical protein
MRSCSALREQRAQFVVEVDNLPSHATPSSQSRAGTPRRIPRPGRLLLVFVLAFELVFGYWPHGATLTLQESIAIEHSYLCVPF